MYDAITPEQWVIGLTICIVVFCVLVRALWHYFPARDMSSEEVSTPSPKSMPPVYIPVSQYGMEAGGMEEPEATAPDIDAVNTGMPRLSRSIADGEMIVLLAAQRAADGKYRYSANAIHALVGGDRNGVLARVKEIRAMPAPAEYFQPDGTRAPASYPVSGRSPS